MRGKRGVVFDTVIFVVLNLIFFSLFLYFIFSSVGADAIHEQAYSKQTALFIDHAKPEMEIFVNVSKISDKAKENGKQIYLDNNCEKGVFCIDEKENEIIASLKGKGGYAYKYFSDYGVVLEEFDEETLLIKISEKSKGDLE